MVYKYNIGKELTLLNITTKFNSRYIAVAPNFILCL